MIELRYDKKSPYVYVRWRENGQRFERSTGILKTEKIAIKQFEIQFTKELSAKKKRLNEVKYDMGKATLQEAWEHYLKNNSGKNKKTIQEYETFYKKLVLHFPSDAPCYSIDKLSSEKFLNHIKSLKKAQNTKYNICKNFKKFMRHLFEYSYVTPFILNRDVLVPQAVNDVLVFDPTDLTIILDRVSKKNLKFKSLIHFLLYSGLRPSDLMGIRKQDIDLAAGVYKYYSSKLNLFKYRPLHPDLIPILTARLTELKPIDPIFGYAELNSLGHAFRLLLKNIEGEPKYNLDKKGYNLRTFRKNFMNIAYGNDVPAEDVSDLVGNSLSTAKKYYRQFSTERLQNSLQKVDIFGSNRGKLRGIESEVK